MLHFAAYSLLVTHAAPSIANNELKALASDGLLGNIKNEIASRIKVGECVTCLNEEGPFTEQVAH
eukprot:scaffold526260_cov22-Prasinocladus_malaysianus.AAC.1